MKSSKNSYKVMVRYLDNDTYKKLIKSYEQVNKSGSKIDDYVYSEMLKLLKKYCKEEINNYFKYLIIKDVMNQYVNISNNLIKKVLTYDNDKIYDIYNYINIYTEKNLNYKLSIIEQFKNIGIIEERSLKDDFYVNIFKKLLQVLSSVYKKDNTNNSEIVYEKSVSSNIQLKGKKMMQILTKLNQQSYLVNQDYLVKPTTKVMEIICYLPDIVVDNENDFKELIDYLYKMFWENKGIRSYDSNNTLTFINDLRRYFFHDLEHGDESKVRGKFKKVKVFYNEACEKNIPDSTSDWHQIQLYIYDILLSFLNDIKIEELVCN